MNVRSPRTSLFEQHPYAPFDLIGNPNPTSDMKESQTTGQGKESQYYMDNYEATITVHSSPPQQRKQYNFDYLEIDDETQDNFERTFPATRLSKRKNLKVTFSDHIEVDFIEDIGDFTEDSLDDDDEGIVEETLYEIPYDRSKGLKQISSSAEFRTVTEHISPTGSSSNSSGGSKTPTSPTETQTIKSPRNSIVKQPRCQHQIQASQQQGLLTKRKTISSNKPISDNRVSLSELEKRTKDYVAQLHDKTKRAEAHARVAKALFPDITAKVKSQSNYKQFIANARRAVEITRRYEKPWVHGPAAPQPTFSVWRKKGENVRRTTSLPRNFKIPDNLTLRRPGSESMVANSANKVRIRNS